MIEAQRDNRYRYMHPKPNCPKSDRFRIGWTDDAKAVWKREVALSLNRAGPLRIVDARELQSELAKSICGYRPNAGEFRLLLETLALEGVVVLRGQLVRLAARRSRRFESDDE